MDDTRLASFRIAEAGYFGGNPLLVLDAPVDVAMDLLHFLKFRSELESTFAELNKPKGM
jgi:hypothetical protein